MSMPDLFDPYRKWLGIPPAEQPPNHYRLLGLGLFEDDADTIASAADRQMAHVRTFQTGPHSALSQKLLNELAAARLTLLDGTKKAAYDASLRAELSATALHADAAGQGRAAVVEPAPQVVRPPQSIVHTPVPLPIGQGRAAEIAAPTAVGRGHAPLAASPPVGVRRKRSRQEPAVWVGLATAALALGAVIYFLRDQAKTSPQTARRATQASSENAAGATHYGGIGSQPSKQAPSPTETDDEDSLRSKVRGDESAEEPRQMAADTPPSEESAVTRRDGGASRAEAAQPAASDDEQAKPKPRSLADLANVTSGPRLARTHRESPPEGKALKAAEARFVELYGNDVANAKNPEAFRKLLIRLINQARQGAHTAEVRYVILGNVGAAAAARGWVGMAYHVAAEITRQFDVDSLAIKLKAIEAAAKGAQTPEAHAVGVLQALALADRAAAEGRTDVASKAASQAALMARKTKDKELVAKVEKRKAGLREQSERHIAYKNALLNLKKSPDDRDLNLAVGRYEVFVLGDWEKGLAKLAKSSDLRLAEIAGLEAEARIDLGQLAPLAAAWWRAADAEQAAFFQAESRLQAKYCYLRARRLGRAGGVTPDVAEQLARISGYPLSRLRTGAAARYFEGADLQRQRVEREDPIIDFNFGEGSPDPSVPTNFFSARWTGFFKPPIAGRYRIITYTNDSVRLWIDGKRVLNRWGQNAQWQEVELDLSDGPHTFRLEYNETFEVAIAMFGWSLAAFPDEQHQQWSPIDALYYDPESPFDLPELP